MKTLERLLDPVGRSLSVRAAQALVRLRADPELQGKMEEMEDFARRCTEGDLPPEEKAEYDALVSANNVIAILQAKARALLARHRKKKQ
jgi:hypothetical protein